MRLEYTQQSPLEFPNGVPVTLAEAREQCRVTGTEHDSRLRNLIDRAVGSIETHTLAKLWNRTFTLTLDKFDGDIDLMTYPVTEVVSVSYYDTDNTLQTLVEGTDYFTQLNGMYPYIRYYAAWPSTFSRPGAIVVTLKAGYTAANLVPPELKHAVLMRVKEWFDHSGESIDMIQSTPVQVTVNSLTAMWRRITQ